MVSDVAGTSADPVGVDGPPHKGPLSRLASEQTWTTVYGRLCERVQSTFVTGVPGVGKSSFLRAFSCFLRSRLTGDGAVVIVAPTSSAAKTAKSEAYHSCFGVVKDYQMLCSNSVQEAGRLLALDQWAPVARRLAKVQVLLLDEILMVSADNLDVMYELLRQSCPASAPPVVLYAFGDFLQLCPPFGKMAFTASCWTTVFGAVFLELTHVNRQGQPDFVAALHDARLGRCTAAVVAISSQTIAAALIDCVAPPRVPNCRGARVMLISNQFLALGLFHGSIGNLVDYKENGDPVVRFADHEVMATTRREVQWVRVVLRGPAGTRTTAGAPEVPGDEATGGGRRRRRRWLPAGRRRWSGDDGPAPLLGPSHRGSVPDPPHRDSQAPRGAGLARPRGRARRRLTGRHAAGAARCAWDCYSPSSVMIASGDLTCMEGIICIGW